MENPSGYLYRVGQSAARRFLRRPVTVVFPREPQSPEAVDLPGDVFDELARLKPDQRVAVLLVHGYGFTYREVADLLEVTEAAVNNYVHRGLKTLRTRLEDKTGPRTDGAFYDAQSAEWRKLPKAPLAGDRGDAIGAWTGSEVVVLNGIDGRVKAAAFDPKSFEWRSLPDPPLTNSANMMARLLATDAGVVVIAVSTEGEGGARNEVARYDDTAGRWLIGEPPPSSISSGFDAVSVGDDIVVIGRRGVGGASCGESVVLAYGLSTNTWRKLPNGPTQDRGGLVVGLVGDEVLAAGGFLCGDSDAGRESFLLDPNTGLWRPGATAPAGLQGSERYGEASSGRWVFAMDETGSPAVYDGVADRWEHGPAHPLGGRYTETPWVWLDGRVLVFSGGLSSGEGGCCDRVDGGYAYTAKTG